MTKMHPLNTFFVKTKTWKYLKAQPSKLSISRYVLSSTPFETSKVNCFHFFPGLTLKTSGLDVWPIKRYGGMEGLVNERERQKGSEEWRRGRRKIGRRRQDWHYSSTTVVKICGLPECATCCCMLSSAPYISKLEVIYKFFFCFCFLFPVFADQNESYS